MTRDALCPRCDDVVAHFLDGDPDVRTLALRQQLDEHCEECADCRETLGRARRLDALLASGARQEPASAAVVGAWVGAALAAAGRVEPESPPRRRVRRVVVAGAAAVLAVASVWVAVGRSQVMESADPGPVVAEVPSVDVHTDPERTDVIPLAARPPTARPRARRPVSGVPALVAVTDTPRWFGTGALALATVIVRDRWLVRSQAVHEVVESARAAALRDLIARREAAAFAAFAALVTHTNDAGVLAAARDALAANGPATRRLEGLVATGVSPWVGAAARLGGARLDAALIALADGDLEQVRRLVGDVRAPAIRPGRADLLLALWRDVVAKGRLSDDVAFGQRLFADLPEADALAVLERLHRSSAADERARCIVALAALESTAATGTLCDLLAAPNRDEAALAAHALGRCAPGTDDLAERKPRTADARSLWLAALASRGDLVARRAVERLSLSAEERAFLLAGGFTISQVSIAARLFRERGPRIE